MNRKYIILTSALGLTLLLSACGPSGTGGTGGTMTSPAATEEPVMSPTVSPTISPTIAPTASPTTSP